VSHSVKEVAAFAGITVRTLHHYDEIGLLRPSGRTAAGYRRYSDADLDRLQQVLLYRELGFPLEEIATILDDPRADARTHLRRQHDLLTKRIARLRAMVAAVEYTLEAQQMGISLTPEERFEVFGAEDPAQYADEAEQRWGDTGAYRQSQERTRRYRKEDWLRIKEEGAAIERGFAEALAAGEPADGERATGLAEEHRRHIGRWFYDCSHDMHRGLAEMYVADPRFTAHYERTAPGLARYVSQAVRANADRAAAG
jgi:DNA-binding transcriptional MerR regulator